MVNPGDTAWVLISSALVLLMSLGLAFFYGGTTSRARVKTLRQVGVNKIHMRVSCPPLKFPCFYGIDFPTKKELIASKHDIIWIRDFIGADSLEYLSLEGMLNSMPCLKENFCTACFTGKYPINHAICLSKNILEK